MSQQTKKQSLIEALMNTATGFVVGILLNIFILPIILDVPPDFMSMDMAITISIIYGGTSVIRSFILRRAFNNSRWRFWE